MGGTQKTLLAVGSLALLFIFSVLSRGRTLGKTTEEQNADRDAIRVVLNAQEAAWNRGDVDAFLVGYRQSSELTFSGSSGVSRGWDGVRALQEKLPGPNRDGGVGFFGIGVSLFGEGRGAGSGQVAFETGKR